MTPPTENASTPPADDDLSARLAVVEAELLRRAPESAIEPTLGPMRALMELLGDPQATFPSVHVAGTNGKSSTTRMVAQLLTALGLRAGCYTSPHLESVVERIVIDSQPIGPDRLIDAWNDVSPLLPLVEERASRSLTYFELLTALAFVAFADAPVSAAAIEVGLGGAWDATNVVDGTVAVVTPIGLDHQAWLGDDLTAIAEQKAGIIKPGAVAVVGLQQPAAMESLVRRAVDVEATVAREGIEFGVTERRVAVGGQLLTLEGLGATYDDVFLPLHGAHQAHNAACALAAVEAFLGGQPIDADVVREGFAGTSSPGRLELVRRSPTVLVDAAHNPDGAASLVDAVQDSFAFTRLVGVVGILDDKDAVGVLEVLEPLLAEVVVTRSSSPRSIDPDVLGALARDVFGAHRVVIAADLVEALDVAVAQAESEGDLAGAGVLVTGSVTVAGEARLLLRGDR